MMLTCFTNHFLIAMPMMDDPNFVRGVTYVCEHNENGALGIMINRPMEGINLYDILKQMEIKIENPKIVDVPVLFGGPVHQERGFVIHRPSKKTWRSSFKPSEDIVITTSRDILIAIAEGEGPEEAIISLGYAGWGAGQLEQELASNIWLSTKADKRILFETPFENRWKASGQLLGIDINALTGVGHA